MKVRPLGSNVLIEKIKHEVKKIGRLEMPNVEKQETRMGIVVGVGKNADEEIKIGAKVMYAQFSGAEIGENMLLSDTDIIGIFEEEEEKKEFVWIKVIKLEYKGGKYEDDRNIEARLVIDNSLVERFERPSDARKWAEMNYKKFTV